MWLIAKLVWRQVYYSSHQAKLHAALLSLCQISQVTLSSAGQWRLLRLQEYEP